MSLRLLQHLAWLSVLTFGLVGSGCRKTTGEGTTPATEQSSEPSVRLVLMSALAGALEPCGCHENMLGGLDHAAKALENARAEAPNTLVLASGATFFLNPSLGAQSNTQELWKAETIASGLRDAGLFALALGVNDLAAGAPELNRLLATTGAVALGSPASFRDVVAAPTRLLRLGQFQIGLVGASDLSPPKESVLLPGARAPSRELEAELAKQLASGAENLAGEGAQILIGLCACERGSALRIAETVPALDFLLIGKSLSQGDGNDVFKAPELVGKTLVVEAPNHLQGVVLVDLFVRGQDFDFEDGSGLEEAARQASLTARIDDLRQRLGEWRKAQSGHTGPNGVNIDERDLEAREADLRRLESESAELAKKARERAATPPASSFFRYRVESIREALGVSDPVKAGLDGYYKRVNQHNREAFRDRRPPLPGKGEAGYVGVAVCAECHGEAVAFWRTTAHARAYETLAKEFKEFNLDCVSCHVTGYEAPGGSTVTHVDALKDVQCETCHGPGSKHAAAEDTHLIARDRGQQLCRECHHPPHVAESWQVEAAWPRIFGAGHGEEASTRAQEHEKGAP